MNSMTVEEFCKFHGISRNYFYQLIREGKGPRVYKIGPRQTRISSEANAEWIKAREELETADHA